MTEQGLHDRLSEYCSSGIYPMHMPGHKRQMAPAPDLPYERDVTELKETDDLHHADGILKEAMERTARFCHAKQTRYLVGGSTCGILSAVYASVPHEGCVIVAANCHRSVFHAIEILRAKPVLLMPEELPGNMPFPGPVSAKRVKEALSLYPEARAVIVTSPTYEGVLSDIAAIAAAVREAGKLLIVDEAHGAHLGLFETDYFGNGAVAAGADIVIQSFHKTLPSLTQTAVLHFDPEALSAKGCMSIDHALAVFETSSPSYPLMESIDGCTGLLIERGESLFAGWRDRLEGFYSRMKALEILRIFTAPRGIRKDPSKIVILTAGSGISGFGLADELAARFGFASEMAAEEYVLLMTSPADTEEALEKLAGSILAVDHELAMGRLLKEEDGPDAQESEDGQNAGMSDPCSGIKPVRLAGLCIDIAAAQRTDEDTGLTGSRTVTVPYSEAAGLIAGEYLYRYPPGIPIVLPGEVITRETAAALARDHKGIRSSATCAEGMVRCHTGGRQLYES